MDAPFTFEPSPLNDPGQWLKAGFHCHTVNSDGGMSPEETVSYYRNKGYHCIGITDHFIVTPIEHLSDENFVAIDATENGGNPDIIGVGVTSAIPEEEPLAKRAKELSAQGGFTIAAHPTYCAVTPDVYLDCPDLMAMEILNAYCDEAYTNGLATELWDMLLGQGKRIWGVAGDDAHLNPKKRYYSDAGKAWVEIWAKEFSRQAILTALKSGAFFSTQGPRFQTIGIQKTRIQLTCTPVAQVRWRTFGKVGFVDYASPGENLTRSELPEWFQPNAFVRIELVDAQGNKAWSNPFFVD